MIVSKNILRSTSDASEAADMDFHAAARIEPSHIEPAAEKTGKQWQHSLWPEEDFYNNSTPTRKEPTPRTVHQGLYQQRFQSSISLRNDSVSFLFRCISFPDFQQYAQNLLGSVHGVFQIAQFPLETILVSCLVVYRQIQEHLKSGDAGVDESPEHDSRKIYDQVDLIHDELVNMIRRYSGLNGGLERSLDDNRRQDDFELALATVGMMYYILTAIVRIIYKQNLTDDFSKVASLILEKFVDEPESRNGLGFLLGVAESNGDGTYTRKEAEFDWLAEGNLVAHTEKASSSEQEEDPGALVKEDPDAMEAREGEDNLKSLFSNQFVSVVNNTVRRLLATIRRSRKGRPSQLSFPMDSPTPADESLAERVDFKETQYEMVAISFCCNFMLFCIDMLGMTTTEAAIICEGDLASKETIAELWMDHILHRRSSEVMDHILHRRSSEVMDPRYKRWAMSFQAEFSRLTRRLQGQLHAVVESLAGMDHLETEMKEIEETLSEIRTLTGDLRDQRSSTLELEKLRKIEELKTVVLRPE
ncbi:hypothetical protein BJ508DRAFT_324559 [Ascobolus immersus RN42]|uniref:Uncharacterized protein n=1 Tax=Ascobolus immersus RN42 TaxID=1160509 RepID=A0A3N4IH57_ASCIM|nr:hypothetical protein BJ508DRAFT_324559 [Ascobolus immersus RN42]